MGAERAGNPFHASAFLDDRAFGVEVVHILRPVLDRRIAESCVLLDIKLHAARVQVRDIVFGCGTAFDKVHIRALIDDNQRMLELSGAFGVQTEIGLQRDLHMHALGDIDKRTAAPYRAVQRRELVIGRRHKLHEVFFHHVLIFAGYRVLEADIDNALVGDFLLQVMVDKLGIVLRADAGKRLSLRLRNTQLVKSVLDFLRDIFPVSLHIRLAADIVGDAVHIETVNRRAPVRYFQ